MLRANTSIFANFGTAELHNKDGRPMLSLLRPTEVAHRLGVSRAWVYDAAKRGRISSIRIGGEEGPLRFVPEDLELWIDDARAAWTPGRPAVVTRNPRPSTAADAI